MKKLIPLLGLTGLLMGTQVLAGHDQGYRQGPVFDYARVVKVQPIVRKVRVSTPTRECWEEQVTQAVPRRAGTGGSAIVGGLIGGLIGNQFGVGRGRDAMTVLGVMVGSAVAQDAARQREIYGETVSYPVQRCQTREQISFRERIDAYQVTYKYQGRLYSTRMPYDPGKRIKIRVDVRPTVEEQYR